MQRRPRPLSLPFDFSAVPEEPVRPPTPLPARRPPAREGGSPGELGSAPKPPVRDEPAVISVGELDRRLKRLVEGGTAGVHVEGEISGLREHTSGHGYFTLKDEQEEATIDCVMYRTAPPRARRLLKDGARVVLIGRATFYAPRGRLQLQADDARPAGRGALLEALERLKETLAAEGLFAPERKRALPRDPRVIGVITSGDGAAIHDIVKVAFRRAAVRVVLARASVQGALAAVQMVRAITLLERLPEVEVIILGRGGGSADDLAAFNDELLVRRIAAARVPVVSAVGHEIDITLADLVADARAATPSQAAELLVPDAVARAADVDHLRARMRRAVEQRLRGVRGELDRLEAGLGTPERLLEPRRREVADAFERLSDAVRVRLAATTSDLGRLERRLATRHPSAVIAGARAAFGPLEVRLGAAARRAVAARRRELGRAAASLDALSPLAVLGRGYAIATDAAGRALRDAAEVAPGDAITVRLHRGSLRAEILAVTPASTPAPGDPR